MADITPDPSEALTQSVTSCVKAHLESLIAEGLLATMPDVNVTTFKKPEQNLAIGIDVSLKGDFHAVMFKKPGKPLDIDEILSSKPLVASNSIAPTSTSLNIDMVNKAAAEIEQSVKNKKPTLQELLISFKPHLPPVSSTPPVGHYLPNFFDLIAAPVFKKPPVSTSVVLTDENNPKEFTWGQMTAFKTVQLSLDKKLENPAYKSMTTEQQDHLVAKIAKNLAVKRVMQYLWGDDKLPFVGSDPYNKLFAKAISALPYENPQVVAQVLAAGNQNHLLTQLIDKYGVEKANAAEPEYGNPFHPQAVPKNQEVYTPKAILTYEQLNALLIDGLVSVFDDTLEPQELHKLLQAKLPKINYFIEMKNQRFQLQYHEFNSVFEVATHDLQHRWYFHPDGTAAEGLITPNQLNSLFDL